MGFGSRYLTYSFPIVMSFLMMALLQVQFFFSPLYYAGLAISLAFIAFLLYLEQLGYLSLHRMLQMSGVLVLCVLMLVSVFAGIFWYFADDIHYLGAITSLDDAFLFSAQTFLFFDTAIQAHGVFQNIALIEDFLGIVFLWTSLGICALSMRKMLVHAP